MMAFDTILSKIKLPIEFSRSTRSISERDHFKANEWRTIAFYLIIPILYFLIINDADLFKRFKNYLYNLLKYIIFLRILCQDSIEQEELRDANTIINEFCWEYQTLYGKDFMTFNLHGHLHLPKQVKRFGPLHKCSCFPFENVFHISQNCFHGTRNIESQIIKNIIKKKNNRLELNDLNQSSNNINIKNFIKKYLLKKRKKNLNSKENNLLNARKIFAKNIKFENIDLLSFLNISEDSYIYESDRAVFNSKGIVIKFYDILMIYNQSKYMFF